MVLAATVIVGVVVVAVAVVAVVVVVVAVVVLAIAVPPSVALALRALYVFQKPSKRISGARARCSATLCLP